MDSKNDKAEGTVDPQDLRDLAAFMVQAGRPVDADIVRAAADTIDALRAKEMVEYAVGLEASVSEWMDRAGDAVQERDEARDEVARLRDALRKIAACPCRTHHACQKVGMERLRCVTCIARAELGEETDG